jgi:hypothetical protein
MQATYRSISLLRMVAFAPFDRKWTIGELRCYRIDNSISSLFPFYHMCNPGSLLSQSPGSSREAAECSAGNDQGGLVLFYESCRYFDLSALPSKSLNKRKVPKATKEGYLRPLLLDCSDCMNCRISFKEWGPFKPNNFASKN